MDRANSSARFRADQVGSLLRPPFLLEARRRLDAGTIEPDELRSIEDNAIAAAVARQQEAGIDVITDGEFRRRDFRTGFAEGVRYVQLDNPGYGRFVGGHGSPDGFGLMAATDAAAVAGVARPAGVTI